MNADAEDNDRVSDRTIGGAFTDCYAGVGFVEKVYANALAHELPNFGLEVWQCAD